MTSFKVVDTLTKQVYTAKDTFEVEHAIDWILSGQDLAEYEENEIDAVVALVSDGDPFVHSDVLGVSVETVL